MSTGSHPRHDLEPLLTSPVRLSITSAPMARPVSASARMRRAMVL